jgi:predicted DNA-binding transcriptional regulator YafY
MILTESSRTERIAQLTRLLVEGREINAAEVAQVTGVPIRYIQRDLNEVSRVIPIYYDAGVWYYISPSDPISPF